MTENKVHIYGGTYKLIFKYIKEVCVYMKYCIHMSYDIVINND